MKQIFDWMREQFKEDIEWYETHGINEDFNRGIIGEANKGISLVDEAKAKWEADCCVWEAKRFFTFDDDDYDDSVDFVYEPHFDNHYHRDKSEWNYCPVCGKPIKISEVE